MISIPVHGGQTSNELQTPEFYPALVTLETLGMPKLQSRGPRRSSRLDLPGDLVLKRLSCLNLLGDLLVLGDPRRSSCLDLPRDLVLERLSCLNLLGDPLVPGVPGVPGGHHTSTCPGTQLSGGHHASTCLGIQSLGGCHTSACLGICTLTQICLALRLQQFWVG